MRDRRLWTGAVVLCVSALGWSTLGAKKKADGPVTQTIALPKDPPLVTVGETRRLVFQVSPLSGKGPLAQQARDSLRAALRLNGGLPVIHLRAFVAGSGDVRRIPQLVGEVFAEKKMPLPSISLLRVGSLPAEDAQVVFETVSLAKRDVNPTGLDFAVSDAVTAPDPTGSAMPLLARALNQLFTKLQGNAALAVSCFVSNMSEAAALSAAAAERFPGAATNVIQTQRGPYQAFAFCEAVSRGNQVTAEKLAFTGTRVAFGAEEKGVELTFQRLNRDLAEAGAPAPNIVFMHLYPLTSPIGVMAREVSRRLHPSTALVAVIPSEGLASIDAGLAVDAVSTVGATVPK